MWWSGLIVTVERTIDRQPVMSDFFSSPTFQAGVGLLVLSVLIALAFRAVSSWRDYAADDQLMAEDILANLEEMRLKGDITDEEFRTMKARTHSQLVEARNDEDSPPNQEESSSN